MLVYLSMIGIVYFIANLNIVDYIKINEVGVRKKSFFIILSIFIVLVLVAGLRYGVGTDFYTYKGLFEYYMHADLWNTLLEDEGFFWVIPCIIGMFTDNVTYVYIAFAMIIVGCVLFILNRYSVHYAFSLFLYITSMDYFTSFNGIRQWTAATIIFVGFMFLLEKKYMKYLLVLLFAYKFHNSSVVLIPLTCLVLLSPKSWIFNIVLITAFICLYLAPGIADTLFSLIIPSDYQHYLQIDATDDGINIFRVFVAVAPVIISRLFYDKLIEGEDIRYMNFLINFSMVNCFILLLATRSTVLARITMYTSLYNVLLIPYFIKLFKEDDRKIARYMIMFLFFCYMYLLLPKDSNLLPYRTIFSM